MPLSKPIKIRRTCRLVFLTILCLALADPLLADEASEYQKNVAAIGQQIEEISRNLNANKALLKTQQDELLGIEQEIASLEKQLVKTADNIATQTKQSDVLQQKIEQSQAQQQDDMQALADLLLSRYTNGKTNYMKMLLNQENPYAVGRVNNYYEYFAQARQQKLTKLREQIEQLEGLQDQQAMVLAELEQAQTQLQRQQGQLDQNKQARLKSVTALNSKVISSSEKLDKLKQDRVRLNRLLEEIAIQAEKLRKLEEQRIAEEKRQAEEAAKNKTSPPPTTKKPVIRELVAGGFIKQQGRLSYPVQGEVKYSYNSRLPESGMRAEGIFFDTNGSVAVNSIYRGRVLFADFLKGYGLLLIIDHGDNHISLYGHNERVYKNVGDMVETNEVVAKSGVTGGLRNHGLYFEVRNSATPVDPAKWCQ